MRICRIAFLKSLTDRSSLGRRLAEATLACAGVRIAGMGATFLIGVQLARYLGPAGYGIYGTVIAIVALAVVPAQFGLPQLITRELSSSAANGAVGRAKGALCWFTCLVTTTSALATVAIWLTSAVWRSPKDASFSHTFMWGLVSLTPTALINLGIGALRGFHQVISAQFYDALLRPALFAILLFGVEQGLSGLNAAGAMALQTLAGIVTAMICGAHVITSSPDAFTHVRPQLYGREWARSAIPMMGAEVLRILDGQYAVVLLAIMASLTQAGIFRVALAAAAFIGLPSTLINLVIMPFVAQLHTSSDSRRLQLVASGAALTIFASTGAGTLCLCLFGQPLVGLIFGKAFLQAWFPLTLMGVAYTVNGFFGAGTIFLNMCGHERTVAAVYAMRPALGICCTCALLSSCGASAAAIAMIVCELGSGVILWRTAARALQLDISVISSLTFLAARLSLKPLRSVVEVGNSE
jgi:O-antigen/teichoic acid export membrane protein